MSPERLGQFGEPPAGGPTDRGEFRRHGVSAAPGIVVGRAYLRDRERIVVPRYRVSDSEAETARFRDALGDTRAQIVAIRTDMADRMGEDHARIFDAHLLIIDDDMLSGRTRERIAEEKLNAAAAFDDIVADVLRSFGSIDDEYLKDRSMDIVDVKRRVLRNLMGRGRGKANAGPDEASVIVAHDLAPSDTAQIDRARTLAYVTDLGGRTSHTAILARSQGVPAVVGLGDLFDSVREGDMIIVDGNTGIVVVNPTESTLDEYEHEIRRFHDLEEQLLTLTGYPASTLDGKEFELGANIDMPEEIQSAIDYGAQGVGLFRTEYFFISQDELPGEEQQYAIYRRVAEDMNGRPVTIRTIDIGGDKIARYLPSAAELNPFMGWRGIRFCLTRLDIFQTQLRAIYRASAHGKVRIMFPMISSIDEVERAQEICAEVRQSLDRDGLAYDASVPLGIMIETPSSVVIADQLGKVADFFSIGTNDLIQYTIAVDRGNARIAHLYRNLHPAILRLLKQTVDAARKREIPVGVCGEMCSDPLAVLILIGLRIDSFSASPGVIPEIKRIIRSVTFDECRSLLKRVMRYRSTADIERETRKFLDSRPQNGNVNQVPN